MQKIFLKYPVLSIIVVVILSLLPMMANLNVTIMEARNFITAREMILDGNWWLTTMNGVARYQKPPLPTWLTAISGLIFGIKNVLALRSVAILMVILIGVYIYKLSLLILKDNQHSMINALIGITSFYILGITIEAPWDIYTHAFMLIGIYYMARMYITGEHVLRYAVLIGILTGLSFMSKGPISLYTLFLPFIFAYGVTYGFKALKSGWLSYVVIVFFAAVVGFTWFLSVRILDPDAFNQIAQKETSNWHSYNVKPFYFYWSFFIQSGIWTIPALISLFFWYVKKRISDKKAYKFTILWTAFSVVLLSVVPEKKARYVVPALIPLALNAGFYIKYLVDSYSALKFRWEKIPVWFHFGFVAVLSVLAPFAIVIYFWRDNDINVVSLSFLFWAILSVVAGGAGFFYLYKKELLPVFLNCVLQFVIIVNLVLPVSQKLKTGENNSLENLSSKAQENSVQLYGYKYIAPEIIWQYGDKLLRIERKDENAVLPDANRFWVLSNDITDEELDAFGTKYTIQKLQDYDLNPKMKKFGSHNKRLLCSLYEFRLK